MTGPAGRGVISIERPLEENLRVLAMAKGREVSDLTVALLDRPRNESLMKSVRAAGARVRVFGDGDVANAVYAVMEERASVDMLAGIGGSPEGVIAACAARALGGEMQGRLWARDERDEEIAAGEGLTIGKTLTLDDLCASGDAIFAATGVTAGEFLEGVTLPPRLGLHPVDHHLDLHPLGAHDRRPPRPAPAQLAGPSSGERRRLAAAERRPDHAARVTRDRDFRAHPG